MGIVYNIPAVEHTPTTAEILSNGLRLSNDSSKPQAILANKSGAKAAFFETDLSSSYNGYTSMFANIQDSKTSFYILFYPNSGSARVHTQPASNLSSYGLNYGWFSNPLLAREMAPAVEWFSDRQAAINALILSYSEYPITYHYTNSTVSGPSEAAVGDTVTVSAVPDVGYGITDASTQILVTNDDVAVPYTWDAANQRITFTMPQPATNRGGFGSTGQ